MSDAPVLRITDRLRGKYTLAVNDGAGLLNGSDTFTRQFDTPPIQHEAAALIEELTEALKTMLRAGLREGRSASDQAGLDIIDRNARAAIDKALGREAASPLGGQSGELDDLKSNLPKPTRGGL